MKPINDNNIDEILFQLLEGEITGTERERLLEAIHADEAYSKLWMAWQKTVLTPDQDEAPLNLAPLKKKTARIIPIHFRYAAAAALVLSIGTAILLNQSGSDKSFADTKPVGKKPVIQTPALQPNSVNTPFKSPEDTVVPLKEKVRFIAHKNLEIPEQVSPETHLPQEIDPIVIDPPINQKLVNQTLPEKSSPEIKPIAPISETILVSIENEPNTKTSIQAEKTSLFSRITGGSRIKIENDSTTRTSKKIIIENRKYQIIAGF